MSKKSKNSLNKKMTFSGAQVLLFVLAFAAVGAVAVWQSLAAPHNGGKTSDGSLNLVMVTDMNGDGLPNRGDTVAFNETTSYVDPAGNGPWVSLTCSQNGTDVLGLSTGYGPNYPWPSTKNMTLSSQNWTSGGADCSAKLYYWAGGKRFPALATLSFHVNP